MVCIMLILFCLTGCATGQVAWSPEQREVNTTKLYEKDYDSVFDAVLRTFEGRGYAIAILDKDSGIISTEFKPTRLTAIWGKGKSKLYARLSKIDENSTKVKLNIHCEGLSENSLMSDDLIDEKEYLRLFNEIKSYF